MAHNDYEAFHLWKDFQSYIETSRKLVANLKYPDNLEVVVVCIKFFLQIDAKPAALRFAVQLQNLKPLMWDDRQSVCMNLSLRELKDRQIAQYGEKARRLPCCSHAVFHEDCIMQWLTEQKNTCPACMHEYARE